MEFDLSDLTALKKAYKKALAEGKEQFELKGNILVTGYAKYLIEYFEMIKSKRV